MDHGVNRQWRERKRGSRHVRCGLACSSAKPWPSNEMRAVHGGPSTRHLKWMRCTRSFQDWTNAPLQILAPS
eukprot:scaffold1681_cov332-Pavlova_lutheri.AAC.5